MKTEITTHYERVAECMSVTLADRRQLIVTNGASVTEVKEAYPWLFEEDEVCQVFFFEETIKTI